MNHTHFPGSELFFATGKIKFQEGVKMKLAFIYIVYWRLMFSSYRNEPIGLLRKSVDWFL